MKRLGIFRLFSWLLAFALLLGCQPGSDSGDSATGETSSTDSDVAELASDDAASADGKSEESIFDDEPPVGEPQTFEISAETLNDAGLSPEQLEDGWIRLFDTQSPFGWFVVGNANWHIRDGELRVGTGEKSFYCSSFQLSNYELKVDFRADKNTNSGVFLRTGPHPENVAEDCLELNIAPPDNPFPTGSFVQRQKLEPSELNSFAEGEFDPTQWHTYHVRVEGQNVVVSLDGKQILEMKDFKSNPTGHISLQYNEGRVAFRNVLLRPIDGQELALGEDWSDDWEESTKDDAEMEIEPTDSGLHVSGGLGQLQTKKDFGDFFLQASYTLAKPEVNSGIFFRCIRDNMLDGYECQVNHAIEDGDALRPADAGAGAIFRRQNARVVMGDGTKKTYISVLANGPQICTWVNGIQVADFIDSREPNENPRRGLRVEAGPISLQSHDPESDFTFHTLKVSQP